MEFVMGMFTIVIIFVVLPWMILNFLARRRESAAKLAGDPAMNTSLMNVADKLERRLDAIESILDHEVPGWRRYSDRRSA